MIFILIKDNKLYNKTLIYNFCSLINYFYSNFLTSHGTYSNTMFSKSDLSIRDKSDLSTRDNSKRKNCQMLFR